MIDQSTLLRIEALVPPRWQTGLQRLVRLRLHNLTDADLKAVAIKAVWPALPEGESKDLVLPSLKRGTCQSVELPLTPSLDCEDVFQLYVGTEVGPYLRLNLRSEKLTLMTRSLTTQSQNIHINVNEMNVGDKAAFGQIVEAGGSSQVGPQIHVRGAGDHFRIADWLSDGRAAESFANLPLYVAEETCHDWKSKTGIDLVGIAPGQFAMGATRESDPEADDDEQPVRQVHLSHGFWIGRYPVTQHEWQKVMDALPELDPQVALHHTNDRMPVARMTWDQACDFCQKLTQKERQAGALPPGYAYRLPTEAEWEYACRAGTKGPHFGKPLAAIASCVASGRRFTKVGSFEANPWHLHDMLGLVAEWCLDAYAPYRPFETDNPMNDEANGETLMRVVRGGCYQGEDRFARASARDARLPDSASQRVGLRVVLGRDSGATPK